MAVPRGPDPGGDRHQKPNQRIATLPVKDRYEGRSRFSKTRHHAGRGWHGCFSVGDHGGYFRGGCFFGGVTFLGEREGIPSSCAPSSRSISISVRWIRPSAAVMRRDACADSSDALVNLCPRFGMVLDVDGRPIRIILMWLVIESAPTLSFAASVFGKFRGHCLCRIGALALGRR